MQIRVKFAVFSQIGRDFAFDNAQSRSIRPRAANFTFVRIRSLSPLRVMYY